MHIHRTEHTCIKIDMVYTRQTGAELYIITQRTYTQTHSQAQFSHVVKLAGRGPGGLLLAGAEVSLGCQLRRP